jgi:uncharacterized OB-fold protein
VTDLRFPIPKPNDLDAPFWAGVSAGELVIQLCSSCGRYIWYPAPHCTKCYSKDLIWTRIPGTGTVFSSTITHQRVGFAFDESAPFTVVLVDMDETNGVRMVGYLRDSVSSVPGGNGLVGQIGLRVRLVLEPESTKPGPPIVFAPVVADSAARSQ